MGNRTNLDVRNGPSTKIRAEQIKSELALGTLAGDIEALAEQIGSVIGAEWKETESSFDKVQLLDLAGHIDAGTSADSLQVLHDLDIVGSVTGSAARIENLGKNGRPQDLAGALVFTWNNDGDMATAPVLRFSNQILDVSGSMILTDDPIVGGGGTLTVAGIADFNGGVTANEIKIDGDAVGHLYLVGASGQIEDEANLSYVSGTLSVIGDLNVVGDTTLSGNLVGGTTTLESLLVSGDASVEGAATLASLHVVGVSALDGATTIGSTLGVTGSVTLASSLDVAGVTDLAGTLDVAGAASFASSVTIAGDLTVNGTQTVVNTEIVTIADHNVMIDSNNALTGVHNGAGFTFNGGAADSLTFQWSASHQDMELKLGAAFAKMHIGDLAAADISADDVSAVNGTFTGTLGVTGKADFGGIVDIATTLSASEIKIDGDVPTNLYIVGSTGEIKDEPMMTFNGTTLAVAGEVSGSVKVAGGAFYTTGIADLGKLVVQGSSQLKGMVKLESAAEVSGSVVPSVGMAFNLGDGMKRYQNVFAGQFNAAGQGVQLAGSGDQFIVKGGPSGNLVMSQSLAGAYIRLDDAFRGATLLNSSTPGLKLANSGEWAAFAADPHFSSIDSILGAFGAVGAALTDLEAGGGAEKVVVDMSAVAADANAWSQVSAAWGAFSVALTEDNSMFFFNGQLLRSGSAAEVASASRDYYTDGSATLKFAFAVEAGDVLAIQKI